MDDINLDELEKDINNKNTVEDRVRNLHKDKKEAEDKAQAADKARQEAEDKLKVMEKETNFLNSFSDSITKYPEANNFKDKIKEKFNAGYSLEDATVSVLNSEGKLNSTPRIERVENVGGGSATTQIVSSNKSPGEMTQAERLAELKEAEKRGDLYMS